MSLKLNITTDLPDYIIKNELQQALLVTQEVLEKSQQPQLGQINLALVSEEESRKLNHKFADNDYPTDVLSFDYFESTENIPGQDDERAEIVICLPIAEKQAAEHQVEPRNELILLFVHGLLHVLGHDHGDTQQASFALLQSAIMNRLTDSYRDLFA